MFLVSLRILDQICLIYRHRDRYQDGRVSDMCLTTKMLAFKTTKKKKTRLVFEKTNNFTFSIFF